MLKISKECIEKTIRNMIPMKDILDKYLESHDDRSLSSNENIDVEDIHEPVSYSPPPPPPPPPPPIFAQPPPQLQQPQQPQQQQPVEQGQPQPLQQQPVEQPVADVDDIFMEQPADQPIKVNITPQASPNVEQNFFSDEED
jgi:hypothetical protein